MVTETSGRSPQSRDIARLQEDVSDLRMLIDDMRQRSALEHVLDRGLSDLNDKLAPLSSLLNRGGKLSDAETRTLKAIRMSLASPDYTELEATLVGVDDGKSPNSTGGRAS
jgi:hypothetical protein